MFAFVQARMGSSRLPGKVLMKLFNCKSILSNVIDQIPAEIVPVVLTSLNKTDDDIVLWCQKNGVLYFRGDEYNVLDRFVRACERFGLRDDDYFFRVCSDNPFLNSSSFLSLIGLLKEFKGDYFSYLVDGKPSILSHCGLYPELIRVGALKTTSPSLSTEHVTSHLYLDNFKTHFIESLVDKHLRLTIDDQQDMINVNFILEQIGSSDLLAIMKNKDLIKSMTKQINKYNKI